MLSKEFIIEAVNKVVYSTLLFVGIYFIYEGDIVQKFRLKRTNFAESFGERMSELPTIVVFLSPKPRTNLKLGFNFNISYHIIRRSFIGKQLKEGANIIDKEKKLEVDLRYYQTDQRTYSKLPTLVVSLKLMQFMVLLSHSKTQPCTIVKKHL